MTGFVYHATSWGSTPGSALIPLRRLILFKLPFVVITVFNGTSNMRVTILFLLFFVLMWNPLAAQNGCPDPKLTAAEQAAYEELVKARETASQTASEAITKMERQKKESLARANLRYVQALNYCKQDTQCSGGEKRAYDKEVNEQYVFYDKELSTVRKKEKSDNETAEESYEEVVQKARELYPPFCMEASGQDGSCVYSGTVCNTKQAFGITGTIAMGPIVYPFKFVPASDSTGSFSFYTEYHGAILKGGGTYKIIEVKGGARIDLVTASTGTYRNTHTSGNGPAHISLTCKK
jgi:hypothetical protein